MAIKQLLGGRALSRELFIPTSGKYDATCLYKAEDATAGSGWVAEVGTNLNAQGSPSYLQAGGAFNAKDLAVNTTGGTGFNAPNNTTYNQTNEDMLVLAVVYTPADSVRRILFGKSNFVTAQFRGYYMTVEASNVLNFRYVNQSDFGGTLVGGTITTGWHMIMIAVDPDEASTNGSQFYVDGVRSGTGTDLSAAGASISNSATFRLGFGDDSFTNPWSDKISHFRMYQHAGMFPGGAANLTLWDSLASNFFRQWYEGIRYV
jgi:hypothetical protein